MKERQRKELGLRRIAIVLAVLTALVVIYDVRCLASGRAGEGLYVLPFALAAFIAITAKIVTHLEGPRPPDSSFTRKESQ